MSANSCDCLSKLIVFTLFIGIMAPSLAGPSACRRTAISYREWIQQAQAQAQAKHCSNNMFLIYLHLIFEPVLVEDNEL